MVSDETKHTMLVNQFPVVDSATVSATIRSLGSFKAHDLNLSILGENNKRALWLWTEIGSNRQRLYSYFRIFH